MPLSPFTIWTDPDRSRYFLLPDSSNLPQGSYTIRAPLGKKQLVDPESLHAYELSEHQAKIWVASEISGILQAIPKAPLRMGEKILAAAHLVRKLPEVIQLSKQADTLSAAREKGVALDSLLADAGIDSHSSFSNLPNNLFRIYQDPSVPNKREAVAALLKSTSQQIEITSSIRAFVENLSYEI